MDRTQVVRAILSLTGSSRILEAVYDASQHNGYKRYEQDTDNLYHNLFLLSGIYSSQNAYSFARRNMKRRRTAFSLTKRGESFHINFPRK